MKNTITHQLIRQLHRSPWRLAAVVTGGGSEALSQLLSVPGASDTVLEAVVPYSSASLEDYLRFKPSHYCSRATAQAMAMRAFFRARDLQSRISPTELDDMHLVGIGCSASLRSLRPKKGQHRVHIAVQSATSSSIASLVLTKDSRDRSREENVVAALLLNRLADATGFSDRIPLDLLPGERVDETTANAWTSWTDLLLGKRAAVCAPQSEQDASLDSFSGVLFPGAFNPLHEGHQTMAEVAEEITGHPVDFEISIENVDKPPLDFFHIKSRADQFEAPQRCWLTKAPTFLDKSKIFPEATFVVGADTIVRIAEPRYYQDSTQLRDAAISEFTQQNCKFLVFPRVVGESFLTFDQLNLPASLANLCLPVSASQFRMDISSTEIRTGAF
ncbi:CinA family protein [Bremerella sp. JC770]|uniref:CinA family protein n=1 Tax=Bremerella sp. JC770 TaxID=3232137 RepID=UPI00345936CD